MGERYLWIKRILIVFECGSYCLNHHTSSREFENAKQLRSWLDVRDKRAKLHQVSHKIKTDQQETAIGKTNEAVGNRGLSSLEKIRQMAKNQNNRSGNGSERFYSDLIHFCEEVIQIPRENCTCEKSADVCSHKEGFFKPKSPQKFCSYLKIPRGNCNCKKYPILCKFHHFQGNGSTKVYVQRAYNLAIAVVCTLAIVTGVTGNVVVVLLTWRHRYDLSKGKLVIASLAVVDGTSSVLNFLHSVHVFWTYKWPFGDYFCKIVFTGTMATSWLSIGFILIISIERFFGIIYPMKRHLRGRKMIGGLVTGNLLLAFSAGTPVFLSAGIDQYGTCHSLAPLTIKLSYHWFLVVVFIAIPTVAVLFCYFRIIHFLFLQTKNNVALSREDIKVKRAKENRRTVRILVPILVIFIVSVLPVNAIELYFTYTLSDIDFELYRVLVLIGNICFPLHACLNPIIYTIVDCTFRNDLLNLLGVRTTVTVPERTSAATLTSLV